MILRNYDFATKYFDYKTKIETENSSNVSICGWYKFIDGTLTGLLVTDNRLYFLFGEEKLLITESHHVLLEDKNKLESKFSLISGNKLLIEFSYPKPNYDLNVSPFEYIDEDDFKWGDFISNIVNDEERKRNFISNLMECR